MPTIPKIINVPVMLILLPKFSFHIVSVFVIIGCKYKDLIANYELNSLPRFAGTPSINRGRVLFVELLLCS